MRIVIGSAFRNSAASGQTQRYLSQVDNLIAACPHDFVRIIAAEGDSVDLTVRDLQRGAFERQISLELLNVSHGKRVFGSTEEPERMRELSKIGNAIFEHVRSTDDVLVYVESDLIWQPTVICGLINLLQQTQSDIVAPLIFAGDLFYDVWGFRGLDGQRFSPFKPYHSSLEPIGLTEVSSAGSCLVMRAEVARKCRIENGMGLVGWCENARSKGYRIYVHANSWVNHPC